MAPFDELQKLFGEVSDLSAAGSVLSWDQQTYMPPKGSEARGQQLATLSALTHERFVSDRMGELIDQVKGDGNLSDDQRAYLRELEFHRDRSKKLPSELVRELAEEESRAFEVWSKARQEKDFSIFAPQLKKLLELSRRKAECFGYEGTPWNALVPDFERGMTAEKVREYFAPLREATVKLLERIRSAKQVEARFFERQWPVDNQREFAMRVIRDMGYDTAGGRLDIAPHPFCTNFGAGDVRITTRYSEANPFESISSTIHETGHALYEQGLRREDARTPLFDAPSLGLHESQSRLWEVRIAQSKPFWQWYLPILKQYFPGLIDDVNLEQFYRAINKVEPGLIRIEADEVCYNLHIIIRFELEVRLLDGTLPVEDLPEEWNRLYREYLGVDVPNDAVGCLQDVHWAYAAFGYFPSYTFGNIYSAMLAEKLEEDLPGLWEQVAQGRFGGLLAWLRENIHQHGARHEAKDLVEKVTGKPLSADALIRHLKSRYGEVYEVES